MLQICKISWSEENWNWLIIILFPRAVSEHELNLKLVKMWQLLRGQSGQWPLTLTWPGLNSLVTMSPSLSRDSDVTKCDNLHFLWRDANNNVKWPDDKSYYILVLTSVLIPFTGYERWTSWLKLSCKFVDQFRDLESWASKACCICSEWLEPLPVPVLS